MLAPFCGLISIQKRILKFIDFCIDFWMYFGSLLAHKINPKIDPGHPWGTGSPHKRAQEPEDLQKASKMEPKLNPGPSKSSFWATISLPKCSQNGSRPPMGHMEPTEACPEASEAPNDSQHGAETQPNAPVHQLLLGTVLICLSLFSKRHPIFPAYSHPHIFQHRVPPENK